MIQRKECVAMLLAGGEGRRLGILTKKLAKPAIPFGGKYRIIDFTLSNCTNSGIDTVGVLTQYQPLVLNAHIGIGIPWDLDRKNGGVSLLSPFAEKGGWRWYKGTANAIYQNICFIEQYDPEYLLVISGDHIYKMDYSALLSYHKERNSEATIAVIQVPWEEASRFGILSVGFEGKIIQFEEKPPKPKSNLVSMGVYMFNWPILREYLKKDERDKGSSNDFGKDVIPMMLREGRRLFAYPFQGYWKDVGTIESLWQSSMDLLVEEPELNLFDREWRIYSVSPNHPPQYLAPGARARRSLINEGCVIYGEVENSILFHGVYVGPGSVVKDSVILANAKIGEGVQVEKAIIGEETVVGDNCRIGFDNGGSGGKPADITLVEEHSLIPGNMIIRSISR